MPRRWSHFRRDRHLPAAAFAWGLELSVERLRRCAVFRTGTAQIVACTFVLILLLLPFASRHQTLTLALAPVVARRRRFGCRCSGASGRDGTQVGAPFRILLAQDIAIALLLSFSGYSTASGRLHRQLLARFGDVGIALVGLLFSSESVVPAARTWRSSTTFAAAPVVLIASFRSRPLPSAVSRRRSVAESHAR
jgi:Kef-type K+ transport system membrane component KefB